MNTKALLEMKKSYGFYLNKFLMEYDRMKKLNGVIYREKIQRCYKTQNSIASELCACVENLLSSMDLYSTSENWETPKGDGIIDKPKANKEYKAKEENKNENKNEIIGEKEEKNENKINENKINEAPMDDKEKKENEIKNLEESGFNLIKDDNESNKK